MLPFVLAALASAVAPAALPEGAPVVSVTVFNDRARVVREARLELHGSARFDLALLPDSVEPGSVRLELSGGKKSEVQRVDLAHVDTELFPEADARKLLDLLDEADDRLALTLRERRTLRAQLAGIDGLRPVAPEPDLRGPAPKLNPSGWPLVLTFLASSTERLQARVREATARIEDEKRAREKVAAEARAMGAMRRRTGMQVTALLAGEGSVRATLTYMIRGARWRPSWELTYRPSDETVQAKLEGLVWQTTGEEWTRSNLTLSTAIPGQPTALPELFSWRIGEKERFQPVSRAVSAPQTPIRPMPAPQLDGEESSLQQKREQLRQTLLSRASEDVTGSDEDDLGEDGTSSEGGVVGGVVGGVMGGMASGSSSSHGAVAKSLSMPPPAPPPTVSPAPRQRKESKPSIVPYGRNSRSFDAVTTAAPSGAPSNAQESNYVIDGVQVSDAAAQVPTEMLGLAPPPSWSPPVFDPDAPATLAGGFDMAFAAATPATFESGSAARRVPLFAESWPVRVERILYPALAEQAWLVAKLKVPSQRTLPGGEAELFVGADPAGHARLRPMAPGEEITLPLGIDRALKPVRNVAQVQSEKGVFSKDDVDEYTVTIEVANPYPHSVALRVFDQIPLKGNEVVEVEFLRALPAATPDRDSGKLEWAFDLPASKKTQLTFAYRLKRPHGAKLRQ